MKIALCFFGQPRFYDNQEMLTFLRDLKIESVEVDTYMHLWRPKKSQNFSRSPWSGLDEKDAKIDLENLEDRIREIYEPSDLCIEDERDMLADPRMYLRSPAPTSGEFAHRMFYSQWMTGEMLKKSGNTYDLVFKMRTDSAILKLVPPGNLIGDRIWVPDNCPVMNWYNDNFSISSQENFLKMVDAYSNLDKFYQEGVQMNGETMLKAQLKKEGLEEKVRRNKNINVGLVRAVNPLKLQGVWINDQMMQMAVIQ